MSKIILTSIKCYLIFLLLLGFLYPFSTFLFGQIFFKDKANGSLVFYKDSPIGSYLIGQNFKSAKYFHGRYSAANYDATNSTYSNFWQTDKAFIKEIKNREIKIRKENELIYSKKLPPDMVMTSASGLDPHISLGNAQLQINRVVKSSGVLYEKIKTFIKQSTDKDFIGIWGDTGVNVMKLNLLLLKEIDKGN